MRVLVLHLSDIHIRDGDWAVLGLAEQIVEAIKDVDHSPDVVLTIVSGDIAFSGKPEEYDIAWEFMEGLAQHLRRVFSRDDASTSPEFFVVAVPGNHDCNFEKSSSLREQLIPQLRKDQTLLGDEGACRVLLAPQEDYHTFECVVVSAPAATTAEATWNRIFRTVSLDLGRGGRIAVNLLNTAMCSKLKEEPATLSYALSLVPDERPAADLTISVYHHPDNWLPPTLARTFRKKLGQISDIIVSGHEHDAMHHAIARDARSRFIHIEGGALQDQEYPGLSTYNVIAMDTSTSRYKHFHYDHDRGIYTCRREPDWQEFPGKRLRSRQSFQFTRALEEWLVDIEVGITHPGKRDVQLSDLAVFPRLRRISETKGGDESFIKLSDTRQLLDGKKGLVIHGPERSGKTTLIKLLFQRVYDEGFVPIVLSLRGCDATSEASLRAIVERACEFCYGEGAAQAFKSVPRESRVLFVDDFDEARCATVHRGMLLSDLRKWSDRVVVLNDGIHLPLDELQVPASLVFYDHASIEPLNRAERDQMAQQWVALGDSAYSDPQGFVKKVHLATAKINAIIGERFIPPYPIFVLSMLQASEAFNPINTSPTGIGAQYEVFVRQQLAMELADGQYSITSALLRQVAMTMLMSGRSWLSAEEEGNVRRDYAEKFGQPAHSLPNVEFLAKHAIYRVVHDRVEFRYPYQYYHFASSALARTLHEGATRAVIDKLSNELHRTDSSNVLLFLAGQTDDPYVIERLIAKSDAIMPGHPPETLEVDPPFLRGGALKDHVLEDVATSESRRKYLVQEHGDEVPSDGQAMADSLDEGSPQTEPAEVQFVAEFNAGMKAIQILGQVLRNHPGSIEQALRVRIVDTLLRLSERELAAIVSVFSDGTKQLITAIGRGVLALSPKLKKEAVAQKSIEAFNQLLAGISLYHVRHIAESIASPDLEMTFKSAFGSTGTPDSMFRRLVHLGVHLEFQSVLPLERALELTRDAKELVLATWILRGLMVRRLYLFPLSPPEKQKVCSKLGIGYQGQRERAFWERIGKGD